METLREQSEVTTFLMWAHNYRIGEVQEVLIAACGSVMGEHFIQKWESYTNGNGTQAVIKLYMNMSEDWRAAFLDEIIKRRKY